MSGKCFSIRIDIRIDCDHEFRGGGLALFVLKPLRERFLANG
jgi:hypothetical protein